MPLDQVAFEFRIEKVMRKMSIRKIIFILRYVLKTEVSFFCYIFHTFPPCAFSLVLFSFVEKVFWVFFVRLFGVFCLSPHTFFPLVQNEGAVRNTHNSHDVKPHLCAFFSRASVNVDVAVILQGFWRVPCWWAGCGGAGSWCLLLRVILLLYQMHFFRFFFYVLTICKKQYMQVFFLMQSKEHWRSWEYFQWKKGLEHTEVSSVPQHTGFHRAN